MQVTIMTFFEAATGESSLTVFGGSLSKELRDDIEKQCKEQFDAQIDDLVTFVEVPVIAIADHTQN